MTGFGRAAREGAFGQVTVEAKSVNHRFLKTQFRLPALLENVESEMDERIRARLQRGALQIVVDLKLREAPAPPSLDPAVAMAHRERIESLWRALFPNAGPLEPGRVFDSLMRLPAGPSNAAPKPSDEVVAAALAALGEALDALAKSREVEGRQIAADLAKHKGDLARMRAAVAAKAPEAIKAARTRYLERINQLLAEAKPALSLDGDLLLRESAIYAEKGDITEELARLDGHLERFDEVLRADAEAGRRLEFLLQEMLREANTIGSKSLDLAISHQVVEIKAEIEKMKEQVQNLE
jgi:uncharacterized protein (TIGR00255 family)